MKLTILSLIFAACSFGQTVTIAVRITPNPTQSFTLPADLAASLNALLPTLRKQDPAFPNDPSKTVQKYVDLADMVISHMKDTLFKDAVRLVPSAAITAKKVERNARQAELDALEAAAATPTP